ncbi:MAG: sigma-70 family RNA polymerase sigma factor [Cytophagales bacterium]|nr:sigma-70 family RNA polymerase sigma factor [Cytophagales bacterium]
MKDNEILNRIESGNESALEYLYKKYYRMMVKMIIRNSGTEDEAKDIYQEALIVFWQNVTKGKFVLTSKISTYLYSICQNLWRKELERKSRFSNEEIDIYTKKFGVELKSSKILDIDRKEKTAIINQCIQQLSETCRKILTYYYFEQLSMKKIAEMMGFANADTAKTKKYKCKKHLDQIVKSQYTASDFLD